jgi:hypothetical protein
MSDGLLPSGLGAILGRHSVLTSVLVSGYVDADVFPAVAHLFPSVVYLGNNRRQRGYLRCYTDETNYLYVDESDDLSLPDALLEEESIKPVFVDLSEYFISDVHEVEYKRAGLYLTLAPEGSEAHLRGISFHQADGRRPLAIDSFWPFGIRVSNEANLVQFDGEAPPIFISLEDGGP